MKNEEVWSSKVKQLKNIVLENFINRHSVKNPASLKLLTYQETILQTDKESHFHLQS